MPADYVVYLPNDDPSAMCDLCTVPEGARVEDSKAECGELSMDPRNTLFNRATEWLHEHSESALMQPYAAHSNSKGMEERDVFRGWRVPCLGLTAVGSDVAFYAIVALDHQYRVVPLTSTPSISCSSVHNRGHQEVPRTAASLRSHVHLRRFPAITKLCKYGCKSDGDVEFRIQRRHPDRRAYRLLHIAKAKDGKENIIKFTRQHSIELHQFCANLHHAPKLLGFERLPECRAEHRGRWEQELRGLVESFHAQGFVHGDLRDPNMICDDQNRLMLIDFDWAGNVGEVSYPTAELNPELTKGRNATEPDDHQRRR
ncbi:hypothetical protein SERLA73DRAFT_76098 [Serpula lacrymans var. lacrymans S7.3]|uniref:Aminoglycoside phosphotransferase domain-containing protein n=1 Tax=Serpula lacrymans var. lacrymans (strain S7.3) TaxID=936435 RepID=F8Q662_SERL3|nr:hypothetical protein SERLA73DRAFT_76098 [Serpula lacrymans var. lacrymans S7.3]